MEKVAIIERVEYSKTFNLGNYQNERIGLTAQVPEGADMLAVMNKLRDDVEAVHQYRRDLEKYERAKEVIRDSQNHYGREVERAKEFVENFEVRFPFHLRNDVGAALNLIEPPIVEQKDHR